MRVSGRIRGWWAGASFPRRVMTIVGVSVLVVTLWVGQGVVSVVRQIEPYAQYWRARAEEPGEVLYVALGDSAAQGIGATEPERGYVGLLADRIAAETGRTVRMVNLSVSGAKVADVLDVQVSALQELLASPGPRPDVITLAVGGNDAGNTTPEVYAEHLQAIIRALPVGAIVADLPDFQGGPRLEAARDLSATARSVVAESEGIILADLEQATSINGWSDYAPDFFHPDDSGYVRWADAFWAVLQPRLR